MGCEALATKAELAAVKAQLEALISQKLDKSEKQPIIQQSIFGAEQLLNPQILAVGAAVKAVELIAKNAATVASTAAANALSALSKLAGIAASLAALGASVATLLVLGGRIDALENYVDSLNNGLSQIGGIAYSALGLGRSNKSEIETLKQYDRYLTDIINSQEREITRLNGELLKANAEILRLGQELDKANANIAELNRRLEQAKLAIIAAAFKAEYALQTIAALSSDFAEFEADVNAQFANLQNQINSAIASANNAINQANRAINDANRAIAQANDALRQSQQTQQGVGDLTGRVTSGEVARSWGRTVWEPLVYEPVATQWREAIQSRTTTLTQSFDSKFEQSRQQLRQQINAQFGALTNIGLGNFERQLEQNKQGITALQGTTADIQNRVQEQERVNAQANTQLQGIQSDIKNLTTTISNSIGNMPTVAAIGAATVGIMVQSPSLRRTLTDTSREGVCESTQTGGCLNTQLGNLGNGIKQHIGDIANGTLNTAQMVLLTRIDNKLGAQLTGGIGGKLTNFVNWAVVDRVMNLVTMMASIHNAMMLSTSIKDTFFSILDNLLNAGYNVAPTIFKNADGTGAIDASQTINSTIDNYFASIFGATQWAAIKLQWKSYSTIARTSGQVFDNLRSLHNDGQELANMNRNYTAELGNALVDEGIISEENWSYKNEQATIKSSKLNKLTEGLNSLDNKLQAIEAVTSTILNITQTAKQLQENVAQLQNEVSAANKLAEENRGKILDKVKLPNFSVDDLF